MDEYLIQNPPKRDQWTTRRAPTTAFVIHTAETPLIRTSGEVRLNAAESVARFIRWRSEPGAYHRIADTDSVVSLIPFGYSAYGEATGGNIWSVHLALACKKRELQPGLKLIAASGKLTQTGADLFDNLVSSAREANDWVKQQWGYSIPGKRLTEREYRNGHKGFIAHSDLDPSRRSDPGQWFPWESFLWVYSGKTKTAAEPVGVKRNGYVTEAQTVLNTVGARLVVDGILGPKTVTAVRAVTDQAARWQKVQRLCRQ